MAKITLGNRPSSFSHTVKFKLLDGTQAAVKVVYKYRTRSEFGAFIDEIAAASKQERGADADLSWAKVMEQTGSANADYVMRAVEGWDLDEPFTLENVQQLADELPAAVAAIMDDYRNAITQGRLGN
ncbi:phage tail assembly chaperone [Paraburkholderia unamae]|uniref:Tail assembly chaperone n=1 Tax=Paraburkholderia unamae TaxID=219649 RepID=A0ABX5KWH3_9BURK|nr:phage tail assembly chaperone [Paraburkholderia unamae]PVX86480.1 tail assembly chaperone [Paraburkholderia unamae]